MFAPHVGRDLAVGGEETSSCNLQLDDEREGSTEMRVRMAPGEGVVVRTLRWELRTNRGFADERCQGYCRVCKIQQGVAAIGEFMHKSLDAGNSIVEATE